MAYDKVVDSVALDTQLTSIADAIRAKTGGTDSLVFPDGFSQAIAAIEAGGDIFGESSFSSGSFTLTYSSYQHTVTHGLGRVPNYALIFLGAQKTYSRTQYLLIFSAYHPSPSGDRMTCVYGNTSGSDKAGYAVSSGVDISRVPIEGEEWYIYPFEVPIHSANEQTITFGTNVSSDNSFSYNFYLMDGRPYYWIVW